MDRSERGRLNFKKNGALVCLVILVVAYVIEVLMRPGKCKEAYYWPLFAMIILVINYFDARYELKQLDKGDGKE